MALCAWLKKKQNSIFSSSKFLEQFLCWKGKCGAVEGRGLNKAQGWWQGWGGLILTDCCGDRKWNRTGHCERARTAALCFVTEQCWTLQTYTDGLTKSVSMGPSTHRTDWIDASFVQRGSRFIPSHEPTGPTAIIIYRSVSVWQGAEISLTG